MSEKASECERAIIQKTKDVIAVRVERETQTYPSRNYGC